MKDHLSYGERQFKNDVPVLYVLFKQMTQDHHQAMELLQKTAAKMRRRANTQQNQRFELFKLGVEALLDLHSRNADPPETNTESEESAFYLYEKIDARQKPDEEAIELCLRTLDDRDYLKCMEHLPFALRLCFILRDIACLSVEEIARITPYTGDETVRIIHRARDRYQRHLWRQIEYTSAIAKAGERGIR